MRKKKTVDSRRQCGERGSQQADRLTKARLGKKIFNGLSAREKGTTARQYRGFSRGAHRQEKKATTAPKGMDAEKGPNPLRGKIVQILAALGAETPRGDPDLLK